MCSMCHMCSSEKVSGGIGSSVNPVQYRSFCDDSDRNPTYLTGRDRVGALPPLKSDPFSSWGWVGGTHSVSSQFCVPISKKSVGPIWPHQGRGR